MPTWETDADWDGAVDESGVAHESVTNTDNTDATLLKQGYSYQDPPLVNGLVGWWPLHEQSGRANDLSGNGNHGTLSGGPTQGVAGLGGLSAYSFDGTDDYVQIPYSSEINCSGSFSVVFWIKGDLRDSDDTYPRVYSNADLNNKGIRFYSRNGVPDAIFRLDDGSNVTSAFTYPANYPDWTMISAVVDRTNDRHISYMDDSELDNEDISSFGDTSHTTESYIGANMSAERWANITVRDVRYYNRALSPSEIQTLYEWGSGDYTDPRLHDGADSGAVSRWRFDGDVTDSWGTNDGTTNGGVSWTDGVYGQAASFDGTDDWASLPEFSLSGGFSLSGWVYRETNSDNYDRQIVFIGDDPPQVELTINEDKAIFNNWDGSASHGITVGDHSVTVPTYSWSHIVGTFDGTTWRVYQNGMKLAEVDDSSTDLSFTGVENGIARHPSNVRWFLGDIDDVRIYSRALSPSEVQQLYRQGRGRDMRPMVVRA